MPRPLPVDRAAYLRLRWRARATSALAVLLALPLAANLVVAARSDDELLHKSGAWWFFQLGLYLVVAVWVVTRAWLRSLAARPRTQQLDELGRAQATGAQSGVPELDEPSGAHVGLAGAVEPPRRW
ncbi:hypothetical protein [Cellulomonas telluris]|uniref:hypothetical protein n=1 Tax=Cellulomonas telluris TaxID=2306636 RepID=UPI0010A803A9|nr:hypothetical protein [Cellulomonas telluris]